MSKRFIDDKLWSDPWFQDLDPTLKLFWIYLFSICDIIGIWEYNPKRAEFDLCKKLPWEEIQKKLKEKVLFTEQFWIIKTFIREQYPKLAECPNAPLHISVMKQINKKCLNFDLNSLLIDYRNPIDRVQVKVIVKEEVKEEGFINKQTSINTSTPVDADWKTDFQKYLKIVEDAKQKILVDTELVEKRILRFWKNLNVEKSLELSITNFWGTESGWKNKKKCKGKTIDMVETLLKNIDKNKVFKNANDDEEEFIPAWSVPL